MTNRASILVVDDEISNIEILSAILEGEYDIYFAVSGEEALETARSVLPDLIMLDVMMEGMDGYETCRRIKADPLIADLPIIFTTALGDQEAEVKGLLLGAIDYVTKPISPVVVRARVRNHLDNKRMRDELARMTVTDALTGLGNRRRLERALIEETSRLARTEGLLSVIILDIDFFKRFNDALGHAAGDHCIVMVASTLNRAVRRAADLAARYGGEEFACVLSGVGFDDAMALAQSIQERVRGLGIHHPNSDVAPYVTVSVGVATAACVPGAPSDLWIRKADQQLYLAKESGRDTVCGLAFDARELIEAK